MMHGTAPNQPSTMEGNRLRAQMKAFHHWKAALSAAVERYQTWLDTHGFSTSETDLRIYEALNTLRTDKLTVAFVAEFSRGKTELINAIFFADHGRRLLPSDAGRTTMCPTELFYDHDADRAYIRLLPIETRMEDTSITELKEDTQHWTEIELDTQSPEQMAEALREVVKVKQVTREEALQMSLYDEDLDADHSNDGTPNEYVNVPVWRHALISFPHPLLKQGLVVLDTPGLNALGSEPELTLTMLPRAQGVLYLLAADAGVTRSDMEVWRRHISPLESGRRKGIMVVLNKIDTLWDDLKEPELIQAAVQRQRKDTADLLGIEQDTVFGISAQKALLGKVRGDQSLVGHSGLPDLESHLCDNVLSERQHIVRDNIVSEVGMLLENTRQLIQSRLEENRKQLAELRSVEGKSDDVVQKLLTQARKEQTEYMSSVEDFEATRRVLRQHGTAMLEALSSDSVDALVEKVREDMTRSWTTAGLRDAMKDFFDGARQLVLRAAGHADKTRKLVGAVYRKFHQEYGLADVHVKEFETQSYLNAFEHLHKEAEAFRTSVITTMTEQNVVIRKFLNSLAVQVRQLVTELQEEADAWLVEVMNPLSAHINDRKTHIEQRLETLRNVSKSRDSLQSKDRELSDRCAALAHQLTELDTIREALQAPLPFEVLEGHRDAPPSEQGAH